MTSSLADRWTFVDRLIQRLRFKRVVELIPKDCALADCGCGAGDFLDHIRPRINNGYGIDGSIKKQPGRGGLLFIEADLNKRIPLDDGSVDAVTALALIEHLSSPETFVREALRILKPGGIIVLTTPSPKAKPVLEFLAYKMKIISEKDIRDHKRYFDKQGLEQLFRGYERISVSYFLFRLNTLVVAKKPDGHQRP